MRWLAAVAAITTFALACASAIIAAGSLRNLLQDHPDSQPYVYVIFGAVSLALAIIFLAFTWILARASLKPPA
jgi:chromate transport protein ChrA